MRFVFFLFKKSMSCLQILQLSGYNTVHVDKRNRDEFFEINFVYSLVSLLICNPGELVEDTIFTAICIGIKNMIHARH